jgi:hypothetical protein
MLVSLDIPLESFDRLVDGVGANSRTYHILMNSIVMYDRQAGIPRKLVKIFCDKSDVELVLDAAKGLCAEALAEIELSIRVAPEF